MSERSLWCAVLATALADATYDGQGVDGLQHRDPAQCWLRSGGRDFRRVCDLAGFDPQAVQAAYLSGRVGSNMRRGQSLKHSFGPSRVNARKGVVL